MHYSLMGKIRLFFTDSDLLYRNVIFSFHMPCINLLSNFDIYGSIFRSSQNSDGSKFCHESNMKHFGHAR